MTQTLPALALSLTALALGFHTLRNDAASLAGTYGFKAGGYGVALVVMFLFTKL